MTYLTIRNWIVAVAAVAAISQTFVQAGLADNTWGNGSKWGARPQTQASQSELKRTNVLINNDSLLPGQNRTQAMRLEAETGHVTPYADSVIDPLIKPPIIDIPPVIVKRTRPATKRTTIERASIKHTSARIVHTQRWH